jgi:polysaccharide pyruvyl transferase WcaK-like protein
MILIESNCSRTFNLGDEAILSCNLEMFREASENDLVVISPLPEVTNRLHGVKCTPNFYMLIDGNRRRFRNVRAFWLVFKLLFNFWRMKRGKDPLMLNSKELRFLQAFCDCEAFLVVGGGILRSSACFFSSNASGLFPKCFEILLAKKFGKPVFVGAQTMGPFEKGNWCSFFGKLFVRLALNRVDALTVREFYSERLLRNIGVEVNAKVVPDDSFNVAPVPKDVAVNLLLKENLDIQKVRECGKLVVGVSLRAWSMVSERKKLRARLLRGLQALSREGKFHFVFIPTHASRHLPRVIQVAEEIITRKIGEENCTFVRQPYTWREIKAFFGLMDVVIAVSFHSAVFSLSMNVPTLGLYEGEYYRMKMQGIFDLVGLSKFAMDAAKADFAEILSRFKELLDQRGKIRKFLAEKHVSMSNNCGFAAKTLINTVK